MRPTLENARAQRSSPDMIFAGCYQSLGRMKRFAGEVFFPKTWKERGMILIVGLAALSVFIHGRSHCLPGWPHHGVWNRVLRWTPKSSRRPDHAWAYIPQQQNSPAASLRHTASLLRWLSGDKLYSMPKSGIIFRDLLDGFWENNDIIRAPMFRSQSVSSARSAAAESGAAPSARGRKDTIV